MSKKKEEAELARLLSGQRALSRVDHEQVFEVVMERVGAHPASGRTVRWAAAAALGAAAFAAAAVVLVPVQAPNEGGFASKGRGAPTFYASCPDDRGDEDATCREGSRLVFQVAAVEGQRYFAALARREDGAIIWYFPSTESEPSLDLAVESQEGVVTRRVVLGEEHPPGRYRLIGIFSAEPLARRQIKALLSPDLDRPGSRPSKETIQELTLWVR